MPSDTFAEVVDNLRILAGGFSREGAANELLHRAACLLEAAGNYAKASHGCLTDAALTTPQYNAERRALAAGSAMPDDYNVMDEYSNARADLDALAPELKEVK